VHARQSLAYENRRHCCSALHGVTAAPLSAAYARLVEGMAADAPEKQAAAEVPTRTGPVTTRTPKEVGRS
jgi:hypothetical protein